MAYNVITLRFKYRGIMDFHRLVREGKRFFADRHMELTEKKYKDKGNEYEGEWVVKNKIDAYHMALYSVEFKAFDTVPVTKDGRTLFNGKLQMTIKGDLEEDYEEKNFAGKVTIFKGDTKDSWLHKLYNRVTFRDRDQKLEEDIFVTGTKFHTLMKEICEVEAK